MVPPQRHNTAQLHPTSTGWTKQNRTSCIIVSMPVSSSSHLPRRPALPIFAPHIFPRAEADLGPHLWWLLLPSSLPQREEKVCSEPLQGELNQGSFPSVKHQPCPCQPVPGPSLCPSSQSLHHTPLSKAANSLHYGSHDLCPASDFRLQERSQAPGRNWLRFHYWRGKR